MITDPSPSGHKTSKQRYTIMEILMIGITIEGMAITISKNMGIFLKIALGNTLEVIIIYGYMILYVLFILRPVM